MPRNAEVIRQWTILREIETSRQGITIDRLAELASVTTRTIRRDLEALQESGFALYDEKLNGKTYWKLEAQPFRKLGEAGPRFSKCSRLRRSTATCGVRLPSSRQRCRRACGSSSTSFPP
jgi:DNA-binding IclR family transcriptional regulator